MVELVHSGWRSDRYLTYDEVQLFQQQKGSFFVEPKAKSKMVLHDLKKRSKVRRIQ